jgi:hypothetical protein
MVCIGVVPGCCAILTSDGQISRSSSSYKCVAISEFQCFCETVMTLQKGKISDRFENLVICASNFIPRLSAGDGLTCRTSCADRETCARRVLVHRCVRASRPKFGDSGSSAHLEGVRDTELITDLLIYLSIVAMTIPEWPCPSARRRF